MSSILVPFGPEGDLTPGQLAALDRARAAVMREITEAQQEQWPKLLRQLDDLDARIERDLAARRA